jgi:hypothetical protein
MLKNIRIYSSFSVPDLSVAKEFYGQTLGLNVNERPEGLDLDLGDGHKIFIYHSPANLPADFTILNFVVEDTEQEVDELIRKGVTFEQYDMAGIKTDEKGIARDEAGARVMAWLKDPAGNIIALSQKSKNK